MDSPARGDGALFVVLPRLALSLAGTLFICAMVAPCAAPTPRSSAYFRGAFGGAGRVDRARARYASFPMRMSLRAARARRLRALLPRCARREPHASIPEPPVRYGEEDEFVAAAAGRGGCKSRMWWCFFSTSPQPLRRRTTAHVIAGVRDWLARCAPQAAASSARRRRTVCRAHGQRWRDRPRRGTPRRMAAVRRRARPRLRAA